MSDDVLNADRATQDHWIFLQAATWPDVCRGTVDDRPYWHYIHWEPLYLDPSDRDALAKDFHDNNSAEYPTSTTPDKYNVMQALAHNRAIVASNAGPDQKAVAYSWIMHLVGDLHQPLHATALYSVEKFAKGDQGGNKIRVTQGRNLHSLWDGLLGRRDQLREVEREAIELSDRKKYGKVWDTAAKKRDPAKWVAESFELAKSDAYTNDVLEAIRNTTLVLAEPRRNSRASDSEADYPREELSPITLSDSYLKNAGDVARRRIIAAGIRLGAVLSDAQPDAPKFRDAKADGRLKRPPVAVP
jgi:hypothetical protein